MRNKDALEKLFASRGHAFIVSDYDPLLRGYQCTIQSPGAEDDTFFLPDYFIDGDLFWRHIHKLIEGDK